MAEAKTIALTGKGGTGKTMLATLMVKILAEQKGLKVLAIDADSASSLPYTLGIEVRKTVSDKRHEIVGAQQLRDTPLHDLMEEIVEHGDGFDLLTMGRPEEPGCYCVVNDLLKYAIDCVIRDYDVVIIDGEAGPEQLNRRVLSDIDVLLVMSDGSLRSLKTAQTIVKVAEESNAVSVKRPGLVLNRFREEGTTPGEIARNYEVEIMGILPDDRQANEYDRAGRPLLELPDDSPMVGAARDILAALVPDALVGGAA